MNVLPYFRVDLKRYYVRFISQSEQRDCVRIQGGSKIFTIVRAHHTLRTAPNSPAVLGSYSRVITRLSLLIVRPPLSTVYTKPKPFTAKCRTSNVRGQRRRERRDLSFPIVERGNSIDEIASNAIQAVSTPNKYGKNNGTRAFNSLSVKIITEQNAVFL